MFNKFQSKYRELKQTLFGMTALLLFMAALLAAFDWSPGSRSARADTINSYFDQEFVIHQVSPYHAKIGYFLVTVQDGQGETITLFSHNHNLKVGQKVTLQPVGLNAQPVEQGAVATVKTVGR